MLSSRFLLLCAGAGALAASGEHESTEETCALQLVHQKVEVEVGGEEEACSIGDHVQCPGSGRYCAGNQCCPGSTFGKTFPCPSAAPTFNGCESPDKQTNCLANELHCPGSPASGTQPAEVSGFYYDLQDHDFKKIILRDPYGGANMVITPPEPSSPFYVDGIGQNWTVTALLSNNCTSPSINFDVPNKPNPPNEPVLGQFIYGLLEDIPIVKECLGVDADPTKCGAIDQYPDILCDTDVWTLYFPAGNAWVLTPNAPGPAPSPAPSGFFEETEELTLTGAKRAMRAAEAKAAEGDHKAGIVICDASGIAIVLVNSASGHSGEEALLKCQTAALFQTDTVNLEKATNVTDGTARTALLSTPWLMLPGGLPMFKGKNLVGAVAVAGAGSAGVAIAQAAVDAVGATTSPETR